MKLFYYQDPLGNFGDDLNAWLWPRLIPDLLDDDPAQLFIGIGSILDQRIPVAPQKVVFGTGIGYGRLPALDARWQICCVRGPLTARALGLPGDVVVTDAAALVGTLMRRGATHGGAVAFMPHFRTPARAAQQGLDLRAVCAAAGLQYVDPSGGVDVALEAIRQAPLLLAEAMHGAIVADALRVPWIPVQLYDQVRALKWWDWCGSLGLVYRPHAWTPAAERPATADLGAFLARVARDGAPTLSLEPILATAVAHLEARLAGLRRDGSGCVPGSPALLPDPQVLQSIPWLYEIQQAVADLAPLIPIGAAFILVDQAEWGGGVVLAGREAIPFLERAGEYWGLPADAAQAIGELERLRAAGARFLVIAWPAFWWLEHYEGFTRYLAARFPVVLQNTRLRVYDLFPAGAPGG